MISERRGLFVVCLLGLMLAAPASAGPTYTFEYMAIGYSGMNFPFGLNDHGQVVAPFFDDAANPRGLLCSLSAGCAEITVGGHPTSLYGINDSGQIVGRYWNGARYIGFEMTAGGDYVELDFIPTAINDRGDILGWHTVYSASGGTTYLDLPGVYQYNGINDNGQVVGTLYPVPNSSGFIQNLDGSYISFQYPGATRTQALAINDSGDVAGNFDDAAGSHSFLRKADGTFVEISGPDSWFTRVGAMNDLGQIAGYAGRTSFWQPHLFIATSDAPEPGSAFLMAVGIGCAALSARRRRCTRGSYEPLEGSGTGSAAA